MSIELHQVSAGYNGFMLRDISLTIAKGSFTALIGPNGCGKSTLLNTIARVLPTREGTIHIGGRNIATARTKEIARTVTVLPQNPVMPPAISVEQLVHYGRAPHQNLLGMRSPADHDAVEMALHTTSLVDLRRRPLAELSGGQRQRAFIAMCLAQDTPYLLFDEPTSFLDIRYQYETLDLLADLQATGRTCVVVLHDIAQAARYADNLVVMRDGAIQAQGRPADVVTPEMLSQIYGLQAKVFSDPVSGTPALSPVLAGRLSNLNERIQTTQSLENPDARDVAVRFH